MGIIGRLKNALARDVARIIGASAPQNMMSLYGQYGKPPAVDVQSLVARYAGWVYSCANLSGAAVSRVPLRLYAARGVGEKAPAWARAKGLTGNQKAALRGRATLARVKAVSMADDYDEITDHPILDLLRQVNPYHNQYDMMEGTSIMLDLTGDAYWYVATDPLLGQPAELWLLRSQWVRIIPDEREFIRGYTYGTTEENRIRLKPEEVIHFKYFSPADPWYGIGRVQAQAWAVQRQSDMDRMESANLQNMGRPSFGVRFREGRLLRNDRVELEAEWNEAFGGPGKAGKIKVMDQDWDIVNFGWSPREMEFMKGRPWTRDEICSAFPVPLGLFDASEISKAPAAGLEGTELFMAKYNTAVRLAIVEQKLNEQFTPRWGDRFFLAFDNPVGSDRTADMAVEQQRLNTGVLVINEVRAADGLEPVPWGDVPMSLSASSLSKPLDRSTEPKARMGPKARNALVPGVGIIVPTGGKSFKAEDFDPRSGGSNPAPDAQERKLERIMEDLFRRQRREALANAERAVVTRDSPLSLDRWVAETAAVVEPAFEGPVRLAALDALRRLDRIVPSANWQSLRPAKAVPIGFAEAVMAPEVVAAVKTLALEFAVIVTAKTVLDMRDLLAEVLEGGVGDPYRTLAKKIEAAFDGYMDSKRAMTIARTEMTHMVSVGDDAAWAASGVVSGKEWDANGDACPFCLAMDGRIIDLGESFHKRGSSMVVAFEDKPISLSFGYRDVGGPPLHPNCRCSKLPVVDV